MGDFFADLDSVKAYIDNLLILTKGDWKSHFTQLEILLNRLHQAGLKLNIKNLSLESSS